MGLKSRLKRWLKSKPVLLTIKPWCKLRLFTVQATDIVTCTETHRWIIQPNWYVTDKYKKSLSRTHNLSVDRCYQIHYPGKKGCHFCFHRRKFTSPGHINNSFAIVDLLWRRDCCPWLWVKERRTHHAMTESGPRLDIKTVFPRYGDSHVKDKTVGETVLSLTWESLYW